MSLMKRLAGLIVLIAVAAAAWFLVLPWLFHTGKITSDPGGSVPDDFPTTIRTNGGWLEVSTVKKRDTEHLKNTIVVLGYPVPFCAETASYTFDFYITYRVRLAKRWTARYSNHRLYVTAPRLEPSLPVAFDTSRLIATLNRCRLVPSMDTQNDLLRAVSARLAKKAFDARYIADAKDQGVHGGARDTVREFVGKWMVSQKDYNIPKDTPIEVTFQGE